MWSFWYIFSPDEPTGGAVASAEWDELLWESRIRKLAATKT